MASDGICPGACNEKYRRAQAVFKKALAEYDPLDPATSRPEPPNTSYSPGFPWCFDCRSAIREQLLELDMLAALRWLGADGYPADAGAERVSGSREQSSPSPAADDVDDVAAMLAGWEQAYRELKGWPPGIRHGDLAAKRTECIAWLSEGPRLDGILASAMAEDFGFEVMQWHAELKAKAKAGVRNLRKPLRCPNCKLLMLRYTDGDKDVRCFNPECRQILSLPAYEAIVEHMAAQLKKTGSLDDSGTRVSMLVGGE